MGAQIGAADFGGVDRVDVGVCTEYNFNRDSRWVPYLGAAINFQFATDDIFASDNSIDDDLTTLQIGMRFYF